MRRGGLPGGREACGKCKLGSVTQCAPAEGGLRDRDKCAHIVNDKVGGEEEDATVAGGGAALDETVLGKRASVPSEQHRRDERL